MSTAAADSAALDDSASDDDAGENEHKKKYAQCSRTGTTAVTEELPAPRRKHKHGHKEHKKHKEKKEKKEKKDKKEKKHKRKHRDHGEESGETSRRSGAVGDPGGCQGEMRTRPPQRKSKIRGSKGRGFEAPVYAPRCHRGGCRRECQIRRRTRRGF